MHLTQTWSPTGSGLCQKWATDQPMTSPTLSWSPHCLSCTLTWSCTSITLSGSTGFQRSTTTLRCPSWWRWSEKWNLSAICFTVRCWELKLQGWLRRPLPSPLTSPFSLMSCSPPMSFFNTSSSSVIGHTEHSLSSSPKSLQYNDAQSSIYFLSTTLLQRQWGHMEFRLSQGGIRTMSVCTVVFSIP